jgi:hypothetical protein
MDLASERIIEISPLVPDVAAAAAARMREASPGIAFAAERVVEDADGFRVEFVREDHYRARWPTPEGCPVGPLEELLAHQGAVKILARTPQADDPEPGPRVQPPRIGTSGGTVVDRLLADAQAALGDIASVTHSNPSDTLLEISAPGVSKASALERLAATRGVVAEQVVAFGDQPNDLPMLRWAGLSYAVANAHPWVLDAVHAHAPSVDDEGVAHTLNDLLGLGIDPARV